MQIGKTIPLSESSVKYNFIKEQGMQETIENQKQIIKELYAQLNDARFIIANEGMYKSYIEFENKAVTILDKAEKYL